MPHVDRNSVRIINGTALKVITADGMDRTQINTHLHYLNVEMDKLRAKQAVLIARRDAIDHECEMLERADAAEDLCAGMFGGWVRCLIKKVYLEQLTAREQLMEDIDAIIDGFFNDTYEAQYPEERDDLIRILCDAVCKNWTIKTV